MQNLETIIKLVKKMCVVDQVFVTDASHHTIINHTLEQQGVQKVISILERVAEGDSNLKEVMKELK